MAIKIHLSISTLVEEISMVKKSVLFGVRKMFGLFKSFISNHYYSLNLFAAIYAIFGIPIQLFLIGNLQLLSISLALLFVVFPTGITLLIMVKVAEKKPESFVKTLQLKYMISQLFWVLAAFIVLLWGLFLALAFYYPESIPSEFALLLPAVIFSFVGISLLEALWGGAEIGLVLVGKSRMQFRLYARAYFRVATNCLFQVNNKRQVCNFKNGLEFINDYLKSKYSLQLLKWEKYYDYFRTIAFAGNNEEKENVRKAITNFADELENEMDLNDVLSATRNVCGKKICNIDDAGSEIDYKIGIKRWFAENSNYIVVGIAVMTLIVAIIALR